MAFIPPTRMHTVPVCGPPGASMCVHGIHSTHPHAYGTGMWPTWCIQELIVGVEGVLGREERDQCSAAVPVCGWGRGGVWGVLGRPGPCGRTRSQECGHAIQTKHAATHWRGHAAPLVCSNALQICYREGGQPEMLVSSPPMSSITLRAPFTHGSRNTISDITIHACHEAFSSSACE